PVHALDPAQEETMPGRVHHVADLGPFPLLDAVATCDADGRRLTLAVVNRDRDRAHAASIELIGGAARDGLVAEVTGPDVGATNSFEHPRRVDVTERKLSLSGPRVDHEFPAHSVTVIMLDAR